MSDDELCEGCGGELPPWRDDIGPEAYLCGDCLEEER